MKMISLEIKKMFGHLIILKSSTTQHLLVTFILLLLLSWRRIFLSADIQSVLITCWMLPFHALTVEGPSGETATWLRLPAAWYASGFRSEHAVCCHSVMWPKSSQSQCFQVKVSNNHLHLKPHSVCVCVVITELPRQQRRWPNFDRRVWSKRTASSGRMTWQSLRVLTSSRYEPIAF